MKKIKKVSLLLFVLLWMLIYLSSCTVDFVPDPVDPDLTVYSTGGKNTASALINGEAWNSFSSCGSYFWCPRITAISEVDNSRLILSIRHGSMVHSNKSYSIQFVLEDVNINSANELMQLDNLQFPLDSQPHYATINSYGPTSHEGKLFIREVIEVDSDHFIIAGTFGFILQDGSGKIYEVFNGRFDSYISYEAQ